MLRQLPVGIPSSLLPRPKPLTTVPVNFKGYGSWGASGPTTSSRLGLSLVLAIWERKGNMKKKKIGESDRKAYKGKKLRNIAEPQVLAFARCRALWRSPFHCSCYLSLHSVLIRTSRSYCNHSMPWKRESLLLVSADTAFSSRWLQLGWVYWLRLFPRSLWCWPLRWRRCWYVGRVLDQQRLWQAYKCVYYFVRTQQLFGWTQHRCSYQGWSKVRLYRTRCFNLRACQL